MQPVLEGGRLSLRPLLPDDFDPLFLAASDPRIWEQHPKCNRYERTGFELFFKEAIDSKGALVVIDNRTKKIIGSSRYYNYDPELSKLTIGATFLDRQYWGGDYNKEMKKLMIDHAFQFVNTIEFHVGEKNYRSQKALGKIGIAFSHFVETKYDRGEAQKTCVYTLRKNDWCKQRD